MTEFLCEICDHEIFEDKSELDKYLDTGRKTNDRTIYKTYIIKNNNLDIVDKILNDYIGIHNKKFDFFFLNVILISLSIITLQI